MRLAWSRSAILGVVPLFALSSLVAASDAAAGERRKEPRLTVGLGVGAAVELKGEVDPSFVPVPSFEYENRRFSMRSSGPGVEFDVVPWKAVQAGPLVRYRFGRDGDNDAVSRLPDVDDSVEVGLHAGVGVPVRVFGVDDKAVLTGKIEVLQDVAGGHGGLLADLSLGVLRKFGKRWRASGAASVGVASGAYMQAFYEVSAAGSAASGLPAFDTDRGFKDVGLRAGVSYRLTQNWNIGGGVAYVRLVGDAAKSPVTKETGDRDKVFFGVRVKYRLF